VGLRGPQIECGTPQLAFCARAFSTLYHAVFSLAGHLSGMKELQRADQHTGRKVANQPAMTVSDVKREDSASNFGLARRNIGTKFPT
jgi:hypothetical protein